jgi:hypothetical protein
MIKKMAGVVMLKKAAGKWISELRLFFCAREPQFNVLVYLLHSVEIT